MAEKSDVKFDANQKQDEAKGKNSAQGVVDYLQAPRKKRKNFIVFAAGPSVDDETLNAMIRFARASYPKFSVSTPQNPDEFLRQFSRNIILAVVDDQFAGLAPTLDLVKQMKLKKSESAVPVLFMTSDPNQLIQEYRKVLQAWHEVDEYVVPSVTPRHYLYAKIKNGVDDKYRRRSRRYKMQFPVVYTVLDQGEKKFSGQILDISIHGALLQASNEFTFSPKDQITVHIPYGQFVKDGETDVIRVAAKIKRIFIAGDKAGISWEYLSEGRIEQLTRLVTSMVDSSLLKTAASLRAKIAKQEAEAKQAHPGPPSG